MYVNADLTVMQRTNLREQRLRLKSQRSIGIRSDGSSSNWQSLRDQRHSVASQPSDSKPPFSVLFTNARSVCNLIDTLQFILDKHCPMLFGLVETGNMALKSISS